MRVLGVDYGDARTGDAISDPTGFLASAVETVESYVPERAADAVARIAAERKVERIVLGLPRNMDGSEGFRAEKTRAFAKLLAARTGLPVHLWDERQSTDAAHRVLAENGRSGKKRKPVIDQVAAVLILQSWLDGRSQTHSEIKGETIMEKKKLGYGVLGLGIGRLHAKAAFDYDGCDLVGVCDWRPDRLEKHRREYPEMYPDLKVYPTFEDMLADPAIDIVSVATPSGTHAKYVCQALRAGKHVLVEKPIDVTMAAAQSIVDCMKETGKKVACVFQNRRLPSVMSAKEAVDKGRLGKLFAGEFRVDWYRTDAYFADGGWRGTWAMDGGGSLMNQAVHTVDLMQYLMGEVHSVRSLTALVNHNIETEDLTKSIITFKNGAIATFTSTTCAYPGLSTDICLHGTDGTIELDADRIKVWKIRNTSDEAMNTEEETMMKGDGKFRTAAAMDPNLVTGHPFHVQDIVEAVRDGREPAVGPVEAMKALKIILAVYESAKNGGREVVID